MPALIVLEALLHSMEVVLGGRTYRLDANNNLQVVLMAWGNKPPIDASWISVDSGNHLSAVIRLAGRATPYEIAVISSNIGLNKAKGCW